MPESSRRTRIARSHGSGSSWCRPGSRRTRAGSTGAMGVLDEIVAHKRAEVTAARARRPLPELSASCRDFPPARDFAAALRPSGGERVRIIAEVKRASPSKGVMAGGLDPAAQAGRYAAAGAAAVSVLTDLKYFGGSLDDLVAVRAAVDAPVLRKEFI